MTSNSRQLLAIVALALTIGVITVAGAVILSAGAPGSSTAKPLPISGPAAGQYQILPELQRPAFTLTDTEGRRFEFASGTKGFATLLYFGYTQCPDVCPLVMGNIRAAMRQLDASQIARLKVVFVSVDPEHDTPDVLGSWLSQFGEGFIGLTGSTQQLREAQEAVRQQPGGPGSHETELLLFPPKGPATGLLATDTPEQIATALAAATGGGT